MSERLQQKLNNWIKKLSGNTIIKEDLRNTTKIGFLSFIDGWQHRDDISYIAEQKQRIVELFKPEDSVIQKVNGYFKDYDGLTIGVHVRRGDYKKYLGAHGGYILSPAHQLQSDTSLENMLAFYETAKEVTAYDDRYC